MTAPPNVAVLMGGPDAEREVSLMSGREVALALRSCGRFTVQELIIDAPTAGQLQSMLAPETEVVFPVLHGHWGEGGPLQQVLEELHVPYVGSRPKAAFLAMDKIATKSLIACERIQSPRSREIRPDDPCDIDPPVVIKPVDDGSSVDLRICRTSDEIVAARAALHPRRPRLMVEQYIQGREITAGILFGRPLPLIEIVPAVEYYDYQAKYIRDDTKYVVNPALPEGIAEQCVDAAMRAFSLLGCRDVARVDFIVDEKGAWFLEINTLPGFTTHSLVPLAAKAAGFPMADLCADLVETALKRGAAVVRPTFSPPALSSNRR